MYDLYTIFSDAMHNMSFVVKTGFLPGKTTIRLYLHSLIITCVVCWVDCVIPLVSVWEISINWLFEIDDVLS